MKELTKYQYRGARTLILLHERYLRKFLDLWRFAKRSNLALPQTEDPNYASFDALLRHVFWCARTYMVWICEVLELDEPEIKPTPETDTIDAEAEKYLEHLLQQWQIPLAGISEERFYKPEYTSKWQINYCIDAMLEHAVMHPQRHSFQLLELMKRKK